MNSLALVDSVPGQVQATTALQGASPEHPQPNEWRQKAKGERGCQWKWKRLGVSGLDTVQTGNLCFVPKSFLALLSQVVVLGHVKL